MSSTMTSDNNRIQLVRMSQQAAIRKPEDDWTGTIDRAERRKLQNRLNQRTYRMRQQAQNVEHSAQLNNNKLVVVPPNSTDIRIDRDERGFTCSIAPPQPHLMMRQFESLALKSYIRNSPNIDHLLSLSRLNIQRAIIENIRSIGMTMEWMERDDSISIFNSPIPGFSTVSIPASLQPTEYQRRVPHHPWLDFFPFHNMRDNLIAIQDTIDDDDLCHDLMAFWDTRNTGASLLVWGPSWEPENWEVTPAFLLKWGFLLKGCEELVINTNRWRAKRGEKPLDWRTTLALIYQSPSE
ncbi:unnamed protein product [Penicillium olsonii]|uniref:BZIP domain-containing protein n=1 Tax=Penicillium olsonii TaxID=99116 RepID=A0A9W4N019_PENOL|nr:unnamed protein product [Penicillium olsonii]CAG8197926.1 unnamed protein product [Penicillium olsonii]CAG8198633.1 unnamed protein product [Penicillium olsonii]